MTSVAWVLNLEADLELEDPTGFAPSRRLVQQTEQQAETLLAAANAAGGGKVRHRRWAPGVAFDLAQAWCPTPRAVAAARSAGGALPPMPALAVLQRVNHRAFAAELGWLLPGAAFVTTLAQLDAVLAAAAPPEGWLLKRPFGFSGRARKRVRELPAGSDRRWAEASMTSYGCGLMVEPFVAIECEFALHSWLGVDGTCLTGQPTRLIADADGRWLGSEALGTGALADAEREQLATAHAAAARALHTAGYFGPFATDAYRWRDVGSAVRFQPLGELNARYTMGFFTGLGDRQVEWVAGVLADMECSKPRHS